MEAGSVFFYTPPFRPIPLYGQRPAIDLNRYNGLISPFQGYLPTPPWKTSDIALSLETSYGSPSHVATYNYYLQEHLKRLQVGRLNIKDSEIQPAIPNQRVCATDAILSVREEDIRNSQLGLAAATTQTKAIPKDSSSTTVSTYPESFGSQYNLGRKIFPCPQCRYTTDRRNNLKRHMLTMHQTCSKLLECCGILFSTKASLREHAMIFHYHGYTCFYCGRRFCRKALLKRHLSVHNGQKDFVCSICDYATSHKSNLERHKKVHLRQDDATDDVITDETNDKDYSSENRQEKTPTGSIQILDDEDISVCSDSADEEINVHTD